MTKAKVEFSLILWTACSHFQHPKFCSVMIFFYLLYIFDFLFLTCSFLLPPYWVGYRRKGGYLCQFSVIIKESVLFGNKSWAAAGSINSFSNSLGKQLNPTSTAKLDQASNVCFGAPWNFWCSKLLFLGFTCCKTFILFCSKTI